MEKPRTGRLLALPLIVSGAVLLPAQSAVSAPPDPDHASNAIARRVGYPTVARAGSSDVKHLPRPSVRDDLPRLQLRRLQRSVGPDLLSNCAAPR
jgi:hypothetical protein